MGLPDFVSPMLAELGRPFDSDEHLFEIKWDGIRALAFVEHDGYRLRSRRDMDLQPAFPELRGLAALPEGTVVDGEIVVLIDDRPDFGAVITRMQGRDAGTPAHYMIFDLLYLEGVNVMDRPLTKRREALTRLLADAADPHLLLSDGVAGGGRDYYEQACGHGFEGVVAKRLSSTYQPGRRGDAWTKMKPRRRLQCAIIGYRADEQGDVRSLVIAALEEGHDPDGDAPPPLTCVGRVGSGLTEALRHRLTELLSVRLRDEPLVPAEDPEARWVEPGLYCTVSFQERTRAGTLRAPVFEGLITEDA